MFTTEGPTCSTNSVKSGKPLTVGCAEATKGICKLTTQTHAKKNNAPAPDGFAFNDFIENDGSKFFNERDFIRNANIQRNENHANAQEMTVG